MMEGTKDKIGWALGVIIAVVSVVVVIAVGVVHGAVLASLTVMLVPPAILLLWILASTVISAVEVIHDIFVDMF